MSTARCCSRTAPAPTSTRPPLRAVADALADAKVPSLRFNYPYRDAGKKAPDRPAVLLAATRAAVDELARRTKLPPERLVLGGRSMGGRYCSLVAGADVDDPVPRLGLCCSATRSRPGQAREARRDDHFPRPRRCRCCS